MLSFTAFKRNHMKRHYVLLVALMTLSACDIAKTRVFDAFVTSYVEVGQLTLEPTESGNIALLGKSGNGYCSWNSEGKALQTYDSLCAVHQDAGYNTTLEYALLAPSPTYFYGDVVSIIRSRSMLIACCSRINSRSPRYKVTWMAGTPQKCTPSTKGCRKQPPPILS